MRHLLFITTDVPWPADAGGRLKTHRLLIEFSKHFHISLVCFDRRSVSPRFTESLLLHHEVNTKVFDVRHPRDTASYLNALWRGIALNEFRVFSLQGKKYISEIARKCDLIFADHFEIWQYIPNDCLNKAILHGHNAEFLLWGRYAAFRQGLYAVLLKFESWRLAKREIHFISKARAVLGAPGDIKAWQNKGAKGKNLHITYHPGHTEWLDKPMPILAQAPHTLLFVGTLSWKPNEDGLFWFLKEIWPAILSRMRDARFVVAGGGASHGLRIRMEQSVGVEYKGYVEDLLPLFESVRATVLPLRFGSGMKVKLLDTMYRGVPAISTTIGAESISVESGVHVLIADSAIDFGNSCVALLQSPEKGSAIANSARVLAAEKYTWSAALESANRLLEI